LTLKALLLIKYKYADVVGAKIVNEYGGEVKILSYIEGFSSSNIIEKLKD
jgi:bifunctional ADP-heptose synthase (sugar kinase/adenylyltransferase)